MYRLGHKPIRRRRWPLWTAGGVGSLMLVVLLVIVVGRFLNPKTQLQQAQPVVTQVSANTAPIKHYDEASFTVDLPSDWQQTSHVTTPYDLYRWQSGGKSTNSRFFEIYLDSIPVNFTVNRVLAVEANSDHVGVPGTVSDNCADFTKSEGNLTSAGVHAKWQGIDFLCDLNNYERNVVGTSSKETINSVTLTSPSGSTHKLFFTYTDHNINPDYSTFYNALTSFHLK